MIGDPRTGAPIRISTIPHEGCSTPRRRKYHLCSEPSTDLIMPSACADWPGVTLAEPPAGWISATNREIFLSLDKQHESYPSRQPKVDSCAPYAAISSDPREEQTGRDIRDIGLRCQALPHLPITSSPCQRQCVAPMRVSRLSIYPPRCSHDLHTTPATG